MGEGTHGNKGVTAETFARVLSARDGVASRSTPLGTLLNSVLVGRV